MHGVLQIGGIVCTGSGVSKIPGITGRHGASQDLRNGCELCGRAYTVRFHPEIGYYFDGILRKYAYEAVGTRSCEVGHVGCLDDGIKAQNGREGNGRVFIGRDAHQLGIGIIKIPAHAPRFVGDGRVLELMGEAICRYVFGVRGVFVDVATASGRTGDAGGHTDAIDAYAAHIFTGEELDVGGGGCAAGGIGYDQAVGADLVGGVSGMGTARDGAPIQKPLKGIAAFALRSM